MIVSKLTTILLLFSVSSRSQWPYCSHVLGPSMVEGMFHSLKTDQDKIESVMVSPALNWLLAMELVLLTMNSSVSVE